MARSSFHKAQQQNTSLQAICYYNICINTYINTYKPSDNPTYIAYGLFMSSKPANIKLMTLLSLHPCIFHPSKSLKWMAPIHGVHVTCMITCHVCNFFVLRSNTLRWNINISMHFIYFKHELLHLWNRLFCSVRSIC